MHIHPVHDHPEHPNQSQRRNALRGLRVAFFIVLAFILLEFLGAILSGSLALLADAAHMTADAVALGTALLAAYLADRLRSKRQSYGFYRLEVLAAFVNGLFLIGISVMIALEAVDRFYLKPEIETHLMFGVGFVGLIANIVMLFVMKDSHRHNLNMKAAFLHVLGDTLSSVAVIVGAIGIYFIGESWPDIAASFFVAAMIFLMSLKLVKDSFHILMEGTPPHMDADRVQAELKSKFPAILNIHDFHVWEITSQLFALSAHIEAEVASLEETNALIDKMNKFLKEKYGAGHTTFQVEPQATP